MSKKNESKKAASTNGAGDESKQPAAIAKSVKATRKHTATPEDSPVELIVDREGIHRVEPETAPAEQPPANVKAPAAAKPKPAETGGAPLQEDDSDDLCVFAFRLTRAERDLIHEAAGSAKASKFVRELSVAAARRDGDAIQRIVAGLQLADR